MSATATKFTSSDLFKRFQEYSGTITNTSIVVVTTGMQHYTAKNFFRCPCVNPSELSPDCANYSSYTSLCTRRLNFHYGQIFITAPAVALFLFTIAANPKLWKVLTGFLKKTKIHRKSNSDRIFTLLAIFGQSLVSPAAWICFALFDGKYLACALAPLPYDVGKPGSKFANCEKVSQNKILPPTSNDYQNKKAYSQIIGVALTVSLGVLGLVIYSIHSCSNPLTYYHAKYFRMYRKMEEHEFDDEMQRKAQEDAEANVKKFLEERREKELWDRISSVFEFQRDKKQLALYSELYEWTLEEKKAIEKELNSVIDNEMKSKESEFHSMAVKVNEINP